MGKGSNGGLRGGRGIVICGVQALKAIELVSIYTIRARLVFL